MSSRTPAKFHKSKFKNCELITGRFLESLGFRFVEGQAQFLSCSIAERAEKGRIAIYHQQHGRKNPDFTLYENGEPLGVIEHEDLGRTDEEILLMDEIQKRLETEGFVVDFRGTDPYERVRHKIKEASQQFEDVDTLPCMLVIHDCSGLNSLCAWSVLGAMFGDVSIRMELGTGRSENVFGGDGRMTSGHFRIHNNRISALSIVDRSHFIALQERRDWPEPRLTTYLNPLADICWPSHLHGPDDEVRGLNPEKSCFEQIAGPTSEDEIQVERPKRSPIDLDIQAIMDSPGFRND